MTRPDLAQRRDHFVTVFHGAPIAKAYGMTLSYDDDGRAVFDLPYNPNFDHALGAVHGGVFATMLDNAGWFTVAPYYDTWVATIEFHVRLLEPVERQHLRAIGKPVRVGKGLAVAEMEVKTLDGTLVATGSGTFRVTSAKV